MVKAGIPVRSDEAVKRSIEAMSPVAISSHSAAVGVAAFSTGISSTLHAKGSRAAAARVSSALQQS